MIIRHRYDEKQDEVSQRSGLSCAKDPGRTKQSAKDECDINVITRKYEKTGALPDLIRLEPRYGDFSNVPDFQAALDIVNLAEAQFSALDAHVRLRFGNDPAQFLAFASDKANMGELVKMGLAEEIQSQPPRQPASAVVPDASVGGANGPRTSPPS